MSAWRVKSEFFKGTNSCCHQVGHSTAVSSVYDLSILCGHVVYFHSMTKQLLQRQSENSMYMTKHWSHTFILNCRYKFYPALSSHSNINNTTCVITFKTHLIDSIRSVHARVSHIVTHHSWFMSMPYLCVPIVTCWTVLLLYTPAVVTTAVPIGVPLACVCGVTFPGRCSLLRIQLWVHNWHEAQAELQQGKKRQALTRHMKQPGDQKHQQSTMPPVTMPMMM